MALNVPSGMQRHDDDDNDDDGQSIVVSWHAITPARA